MALPVGWGPLTPLYAALHVGGPLGIPHPARDNPSFFGNPGFGAWLWVSEENGTLDEGPLLEPRRYKRLRGAPWALTQPFGARLAEPGQRACAPEMRPKLWLMLHIPTSQPSLALPLGHSAPRVRGRGRQEPIKKV